MDRIGGREADQLSGTQSCSICIVRVGKSRRRGPTPPGQHNSNRFHMEDGGNPLLIPMQGEPSVVARSHQQEYHNSPPSVVIHNRKKRGRLSQQTQTAEVGLQADLIGVLEDLPQTSGLAHTGRLRIQGESSNSQVHDLGERPQGSGNQHPGLLLGSGNLVVPPGPPHSSSTGGGSRAADHGNFDLSGVDRSNVVANPLDK